MAMEDCILNSENLESCILRCYIQPGASKSELIGIHGDPVRLKIKIKAAPIEGKANKETIHFLASKFGIRKNQIQLLRGQTSRQKDFVVELKRNDALARLKKFF
jgi:uncharacterized protein (TIGR00251 family)